MIRRRIAAVGALAAAVALVLSGCANQGGGEQQGGGPAAGAPSQPTDAALPAGNGQGRCAPGHVDRLRRHHRGPERRARHRHRQRRAARGRPAQRGEPELPGDAGARRHRRHAGHRGGPDHRADQQPGGPRHRGSAVLRRVPRDGPGPQRGRPRQHHPVGHQPRPDAERVDELLPRPGQRRRPGPGRRAATCSSGSTPRTSASSRTTRTTASDSPTQVSQALGPQPRCQIDVKTNQREFSAIIGQVQQANPQAIFYAGYYQEAAPLIQQLRDAGVQTTFIGPDGVKDEQYVVNAAGSRRRQPAVLPVRPAGGLHGLHERLPSGLRRPAADLLGGVVRRHDDPAARHRPGCRRPRRAAELRARLPGPGAHQAVPVEPDRRARPTPRSGCTGCRATRSSPTRQIG